jgi:signal transduction histidine kinase
MDRETGESVLYRSGFPDPTTLGHDYVWDVHEDREGRVWVGTHNGLGLYDRDRDQFLNFRHQPGDSTSLSVNEITSLHEDSQGRLWITTHGGGVNLFDPEKRTFVSYRVGDGLPSNVVLSVAEDLAGAVWLGTNRGLSRFDPGTDTFMSFDQNDGLQGRQFNRGAALRSRSGELLFGGINGFNLFDPDRIEVNTVAPPVVITSFQIFNLEVPVGEGEALRKQIDEAEVITLRHDQSVLSFEFAALNFRNPGRNEYAYMLEGFDADWVQAGTQRTVTYTNLDPGSYTLRVIGSNNSGVWNEEGAAIELVILPPIWATWWFRLVSFAALCGLILAVHLNRVRTFRNHNLALEAEIAERRRAEDARQLLMAEMETKNVALERQNAELERFSYTVSHDLKSPLVTIRGFLGLLEKDVNRGDQEGVRRDIDQIEAASKTMGRLLNDVLELSRVGRVANPSEEVALSQLAQEAAGLVRGQIEAREVDMEIDPQMPTVVGDRMRLLEVFQNLIDNAVQFMADQPKPRVSVGAKAEEGLVVCFVRDNGRGIEPRYQDKIFDLFERLDNEAEGSGVGLALVKRIVEVHGGRVWVDSEGGGQGATFWFSLATPGTAESSA